MRQHLDEGNKKLPIIINICIYAGKESPYPYSLDIFECFEEVELAKEHIFKAVQLIDLTILAPEELLKEGASGLVKILLKQGKERDHLNWINSNPILICRLIDSPFGLSSIIYILGTDDKNRPKELLEAIIKASPDNKEVIMSAAHKLQQEARLEGMQQTKLVIAKNMVKKGCELSFIREITGLSADAIKKLEKE